MSSISVEFERLSHHKMMSRAAFECSFDVDNMSVMTCSHFSRYPAKLVVALPLCPSEETIFTVYVMSALNAR
jgi:hypothetical protein